MFDVVPYLGVYNNEQEEMQISTEGKDILSFSFLKLHKYSSFANLKYKLRLQIPISSLKLSEDSIALEGLGYINDWDYINSSGVSLQLNCDRVPFQIFLTRVNQGQGTLIRYLIFIDSFGSHYYDNENRNGPHRSHSDISRVTLQGEVILNIKKK
ncbi:hypothetical protein [Robiginitalea sp. IMCC43444]|uniref:hypothetical protein n=1 Tax=Robiginitalea sp. IMCC43444 TaxID=3459121 RepID=UPI0040433DF8